MYYVYVLECADTTYYTGCTNDLQRRIHQHNTTKSGAKYTKNRRPVALKYVEEYEAFSTARAREAEIKRLKRIEKEKLISQ